MDSDQADLRLDDGTPIRFLLSPAAGPSRPAAPVAESEDDDLPEGMGATVPVSRGGQRVATVATDALRTTLQPLASMLQEVHDAVSSGPRPPSDISVTFGVQMGQDLKFGIIGANGQAHLTVTASWQPTAGE